MSWAYFYPVILLYKHFYFSGHAPHMHADLVIMNFLSSILDEYHLHACCRQYLTTYQRINTVPFSIKGWQR